MDDIKRIALFYFYNTKQSSKVRGISPLIYFFFCSSFYYYPDSVLPSKKQDSVLPSKKQANTEMTINFNINSTFNVKIENLEETTQKNDFIDFLIKNFDTTKKYNTINNLHEDINSIRKNFEQYEKNKKSINTAECNTNATKKT
ncbi:hypothetical protein KC460_04605 [Candidatus Dependentiae bacterium]|nr:hypothetical protein [Candidatus Dependentiae bacterium]